MTDSSAHKVKGIVVEVRNTREDIASADVLSRLEEALSLIAEYSPRIFKRLLTDVRIIRIERFPTRGAYLPDERVILSELTFLARRDISAAPVASSILHECTHARIHSFRMALGAASHQRNDAEMRQLMAREERLCRKAELEFGMSLPSELGKPVIERALASLSLADADVAPTIDWRLAMARQDAVDRGQDVQRSDESHLSDNRN